MITQAEWARRHGFTRQYVGKLVRRRIVQMTDGLIDPAQADAALAAMRDHARPLRRKGAQPSGPIHERGNPARYDLPDPGLPRASDLPTLLLKTRIKSELGRAQLLDLRAREKGRQLVDADEVRIAAFNLARTTRDAMLNIPERIAGVLAAETDPQRVRTLLLDEIRLALTELTTQSASLAK